MASRHKHAKSKDPSYRSSKPEYYPIQRKIPFGVDEGSLSGRNLVDCGRLLSKMNRRLYRQGKKYTASISLDVQSTQTVPIEVDIYALADTWDVQRAWSLAKATWDEAYAEEMNAGFSGQFARWRDFRVNAATPLAASETDPVVHTLGGETPTVLSGGEMQSSVVNVGGVNTSFVWGTPVAGQFDIAQEWNNAGNVSLQPDAGAASGLVPYDNVNPDSPDQQEFVRLATDGDAPPYDRTGVTCFWVKVATLVYDPTNPSGSYQKLSTGNFDAPCGLILTSFNSGSVANGEMSCTIKAGKYKGVHALDMGA